MAGQLAWRTVAGVLALAWAGAPASAAGPLRAVAFYSSTCQHCEKAKSALREAEGKWGDRVAVEHRDVKDVQVFCQMFAYEDHYHSTAQAPRKCSWAASTWKAIPTSEASSRG